MVRTRKAYRRQSLRRFWAVVFIALVLVGTLMVILVWGGA